MLVKFCKSGCQRIEREPPAKSVTYGVTAEFLLLTVISLVEPVFHAIVSMDETLAPSIKCRHLQKISSWRAWFRGNFIYAYQ